MTQKRSWTEHRMKGIWLSDCAAWKLLPPAAPRSWLTTLSRSRTVKDLEWSHVSVVGGPSDLLLTAVRRWPLSCHVATESTLEKFSSLIKRRGRDRKEQMLAKHLQRVLPYLVLFLLIFLSVCVVWILAQGHCDLYWVSEMTFWISSLLMSHARWNAGFMSSIHLIKGK